MMVELDDDKTSTAASPANLQRSKSSLGSIVTRQGTIKAVKKNKKKCGLFWIIAIVVVVIVVTTAGVGAAYFYGRTFTDARSASVGGAAMGQSGKQSLVPPKELLGEVSRRRRLVDTNTSAGTLGKCPRDSQVIVEAEATPTSVYDGTTIFAIVDQINCLMQLTKPGSDETINRGAYTATVNENACKPTEESQGNSGGGGGDGGGGGGAQVVSLKTFAVNSTKPTEEFPEQPFSVKIVMPITPPSDSYR